MLLRKVLKQWRWNIIYFETFLILMVFYHCSLIKHREMLLHLTPHAHLRPSLYQLYIMCHHGGSRCEGHAVWAFVSVTCSFEHRVSVWCLYRWHSRGRVGSYHVEEMLYVTLRYIFRSFCAWGECSSLWLRLTMWYVKKQQKNILPITTN